MLRDCPVVDARHLNIRAHILIDFIVNLKAVQVIQLRLERLRVLEDAVVNLTRLLVFREHMHE